MYVSPLGIAHGEGREGRGVESSRNPALEGERKNRIDVDPETEIRRLTGKESISKQSKQAGKQTG